MSKFIVELPFKALEAAKLFVADKKEVRKNLQGIHIDTKNIVGTDGHAMIVYEHESDFFGNPITISSEIVDHIKGFMPKGKKDVVITFKSSDNQKTIEVFLEERFIGYTFTPLDEKYPDYNRAIPSSIPEKIETISFNLEFFDRVKKALKILGFKLPFAKLTFNGYMKGTEVRSSESASQKFFFIIMPLRV